MDTVLKAGAGAALALVVAGCGGSSGGSGSGTPASGGPLQHPKSLVGSVGKNDAFTIDLTDQKGGDITRIPAGTYRLTVHDYSTIHDFHLSGAGVNDATQVGSTETKTFTVHLTPGTYTYQCDPHASQMHGSFTVQ